MGVIAVEMEGKAGGLDGIIHKVPEKSEEDLGLSLEALDIQSRSQQRRPNKGETITIGEKASM